jgi:hypothetical protein
LGWGSSLAVSLVEVIVVHQLKAAKSTEIIAMNEAVHLENSPPGTWLWGCPMWSQCSRSPVPDHPGPEKPQKILSPFVPFSFISMETNTQFFRPSSCWYGLALVDHILVKDSAHHFPDLGGALVSLSKLLAPGGRIIMVTLPSQPAV